MMSGVVIGLIADNDTISDYDADCLQHLDEALQAEELAHTDYLD